MKLRVNKIGTRYEALGRRFLFLALLMTCSLWMCDVAPCQTLYGTLTGSVTDSTGAAVPGATVTATQTETDAIRTGATNGSGLYTLSSLPPGTYHVVISKSGFEGFQTQHLNVKLNEVTRLDAALAVGTAKQTVTVSAQTSELQTDRTDVNAQISSTEFKDLPQPTRTYQGLLGGVAGVGTPGAYGLQTNNPDRSMTVEANGTSVSSTDVRIEGVPAPDPWVPFFSSLTPSVEAIETVSMVTGSAEADQTGASGATINVQLKSGTNHFHGSLYEFHTDNFLAARPYFSAPTDPMAPNVDNNFGATLGGPILKNKLFFFASYEGDIDHTSYVSTQTVPTAAMLTGDFTGTNTIIYDPNTGNPDGTGKVSFLAETGRNAIPADRISSNVAPLLALIAQNKPTNNASSNNLVGVVGNPQSLHKIDTKVDWNATDKLRVTGRFNLHPYQILSKPTFGDAINAGDPANSSGHTYAVTIAATYVKSPHFVIDGSWGFTRTIQNIIPFFDNVKYGSETMHISGVNLPDLPYGGGMPQFNINGYSGYGYQYPYLGYNDPILGYTGNATWTKGSHTIKFGFNLSQQHMNHHEIFPDSLNFGGNATTLNGGAQANQYNGFASLLLGAPDSWNNSFQPFGASRLRSWQYNLYAKDTWQLNRQLTLSYGTGWTYMPVPTHGSYGLENYNLDTGQYEVCGFGGISKDCGIDVGKGLFSPSVGIAYRPFNSWVVRGGFAIAAEQFNVGRELMYNYPENIGYSASALNPYVAVGSLSDGVPTIPAPDYSHGVIPLPAGASFYALPQHLKHGYVESYNLTTQKQIGSWLVQVGYVGNLSIHQHQRYNLNYGTVGGGVPSQRFYQLLGTSVPEIAIEPYGHSKYNSLQTTVEHQFATGFLLKSTYTYSKWMALCCNTDGFGQFATPIPEYQRLNYVPSSMDQRHIFNISGILDSPFGKQKRFVKGGIGAVLLGGWQLNAVATMYSGSPFGISANGASLNAPGSSQRADQVKPHVAIYERKDKYFDVTAFAPVSAVRFGTAPYNSLVGPGAKNLDASIFRTFHLLDNLSTQFRIESFNVTNTPHFADPGSNVSSVQYDSNGNVTNLNGFGQITSTTTVSRFIDQRYFRFGLKFMF